MRDNAIFGWYMVFRNVHWFILYTVVWQGMVGEKRIRVVGCTSKTFKPQCYLPNSYYVTQSSHVLHVFVSVWTFCFWFGSLFAAGSVISYSTFVCYTTFPSRSPLYQTLKHKRIILFVFAFSSHLIIEAWICKIYRKNARCAYFRMLAFFQY